MYRKANKVVITLVLSALLFTFGPNNFFKILADNTATSTQIESVMDGKTSKDSLSLSENQQEKINALIQREKDVQTNKANDTTTVTLTDEQLYNILKQSLTSDQLDSIQAAKHHAGVSKVVFHGKKKSGNFDLYLSKGMLNFIRGVAIGAGVSAIVALAGGFTGATALAGYVLKKIITQFIKKGSAGFSYGRKFKIRSWKYTGWSYQ